MVDTVVQAFIAGINASVKTVIQSEKYVNENKDIKGISTYLDMLLAETKKEISKLPARNHATAFRAEVLKRTCKARESELPKESSERLILKRMRKNLIEIATSNRKIAVDIENIDKLLHTVKKSESSLLTAMLSDYTTQILVLLTGVPGLAITGAAIVAKKICFGIARKCIEHVKENKESKAKQEIFDANNAFLQVAHDLIAAERVVKVVPKHYLDILEQYFQKETDVDKIFSALVDLNLLKTYIQKPNEHLKERRKHVLGTIKDLSKGPSSLSSESYHEFAADQERVDLLKSLLQNEGRIIDTLLNKAKITVKEESFLTPEQKKSEILGNRKASVEDDDRKRTQPRPTIPALLAQTKHFQIAEMTARITALKIRDNTAQDITVAEMTTQVTTLKITEKKDTAKATSQTTQTSSLVEQLLSIENFDPEDPLMPVLTFTNSSPKSKTSSSSMDWATPARKQDDDFKISQTSVHIWGSPHRRPASERKLDISPKTPPGTGTRSQGGTPVKRKAEAQEVLSDMPNISPINISPKRGKQEAPRVSKNGNRISVGRLNFKEKPKQRLKPPVPTFS